MTAWTQRPAVEASLLNPALIAVLLGAAAREHGTSGEPMPWPVGFLVVPLVLHRPTREALPSSVRTHLSTWITRHPLLRAGFPARAAAMTPLTREGLRVGLRTGALRLERGAILSDLHGKAPPGELRQLQRHAGLVGRWLARTQDPATTFALFGVRP